MINIFLSFFYAILYTEDTLVGDVYEKCKHFISYFTSYNLFNADINICNRELKRQKFQKRF